jgi:Protein of unknown function (DUF551)
MIDINNEQKDNALSKYLGNYWISCKERMPHQFSWFYEVLVCIKSKKTNFTGIAILFEREDGFIELSSDQIYAKEEKENVWWMPLPKMPDILC